MKKEINQQCVKVTKNKLIVLGEKRSSLILSNPKTKEITIIQIDGCAIRDDDVKCDQAYICNGEDHFVEFKGNQISHAIQQLDRSILLLGEPKKTKTFAEIIYVSSNIPTNDFLKKMKQFKSRGISLRKYKSKTTIEI